MRTLTTAPAKPASAVTPSPALLRRCATCGSGHSASGECEQCRGKRVSMQRATAGTLQREEGEKAPPTNEEKLKEAAKKTGEALLETEVGKEIKSKAADLGKDFVSGLGGKVVTGAAAAGVLTYLIAKNKELPAQLPAIPLDALAPGLSANITYEGPVRSPTKGMITFTYSPGGTSSKKSATSDKDKFRAETARLAAEQNAFREGLKPPDQRAAEDEAFNKAYSSGLDKLGLRPLAIPGLDPPKQDDTLKREATTEHDDVTGSTAPPIVDEVLASGGRALDAGVRADLEQRLGQDFGNVRIHADERAARSAEAVNARAYTVGSDIVFASGSYAPSAVEGQRLLAHELTHVAQQRSGAASGSGSGITVGPTDDAFEREAREVAAGIDGADAAASREIEHTDSTSERLSRSVLQRDDAPPPPKAPETADPPARPDAKDVDAVSGADPAAPPPPPPCDPKGFSRADYLKETGTSTNDFGLTRMDGTVSTPTVTTKAREQGKKGVVLENTSAAMPLLTSVFTQAGKFIEGTAVFGSQGGKYDCPSARLPIQWSILADGANRIREGEIEHCRDFTHAFDISIRRYAAVVNELADAGKVFASQDAAEKHITKIVGPAPGQWFSVFECLAKKTKLRDKGGAVGAWHTPKPHYDGARMEDLCEFVRARITGSSLPEIGKHPTPDVIQGCGEGPPAAKAPAKGTTTAPAAKKTSPAPKVEGKIAGLLQREDKPTIWVEPVRPLGAGQVDVVTGADPAPDACEPEALSRSEFLKRPGVTPRDFGLTVLHGNTIVPSVQTTSPGKGRKGVVVEPTEAVLDTITSIFTKPGSFLEGTTPWKNQGAGGVSACESGDLPVRWVVLPEGARRIRQGEIEHCADFKHAFNISLRRYAAMVNDVAAKKTVFANQDAADAHLTKLTGKKPYEWWGVFDCLANKTLRRDRDPGGTHHVQAKATGPSSDCIIKKEVNASSTAHVGKHPTPELVQGCGEPGSAAKPASGTKASGSAPKTAPAPQPKVQARMSKALQRDFTTDAAGNLAYEFRVGRELTGQFVKLAVLLGEDGTIADADIRALRENALARHGTVDDHERMFIAAILDPVNLGLVAGLTVTETTTVAFPTSSITAANRTRVRDFDRGAVPASVTRPFSAAGKAAIKGDSSERSKQLATAEAKAADEILLAAGGYVAQAKVLNAFVAANRLNSVYVLAAMHAAASDSTAGDRTLAGIAYAVAEADGNPMAGELLGGKLKVDAVSRGVFAKMPGNHPEAGAAYLGAGLKGGKGDTLYLVADMDIANLAHRSMIIHELQHAQDDHAQSKTDPVKRLELNQVEARAYRSEARYILKQMEALPVTERPKNAATFTTAAWSAPLLFALVIEAKSNLTTFQPLLEQLLEARPANDRPRPGALARTLARPTKDLETGMLAEIERSYGITATQTGIFEGLAGESVLDWSERLH